MNNRSPKSKATEAAAAILGLCLLAFVIIDESSYQSQNLGGGGGRRSLAAEASHLMKNEQNKLDAQADENYKVLPQHRELSTPNLVGEDPRKQLRFKKKEPAPGIFKLTPEVIPPEVAETVRVLASPFLVNADNIYAFDESDPRPVMNTFFSIMDGVNAEKMREDDANTLAVWKHAWSAAGWNPRVLNLDHARLHPDYGTAENDIKTKVPMHPDDEYNKLCYLRHFAMAAVGGGWMTDYDTVPVGTELTADKYGVNLPNDGRFTSFRIPCLIVGSGEEWDRIAKRLIVEGIKAKENKDSLTAYRGGWFLFNDMRAMGNLLRQGEVIREHLYAENHVYHPSHIDSLEKGTSVCDLTQEWWAIHFAHYGFELYGHGELYKCKCRALVMAATLQHLSDTCGGMKFQFDKPEIALARP